MDHEFLEGHLQVACIERDRVVHTLLRSAKNRGGQVKVVKSARGLTVDRIEDAIASGFHNVPQDSITCPDLFETEAVENRRFRGGAGIRLGRRRSAVRITSLSVVLWAARFIWAEERVRIHPRVPAMDSESVERKL